jgi:hypothetical protein
MPGLGAVFSNFWEVSEQRGTVQPFLEQKPHYWVVERHEVAPGVLACEARSLARQFVVSNFFGRSTLVMRRDLLVSIGLFNRNFIHLEDRECWLRLLVEAQFAVLEEPLMWSRIDEEHDPHRSRSGYETPLDAIRLGELVAAHPNEYPPEAARPAVATVSRSRPLGGSGRSASRRQTPRLARVVARGRSAAADAGRTAGVGAPGHTRLR